MFRVFFLLLCLFPLIESCTFAQKSITTTNSSPAILEENIPVYRCKPKKGQDEAFLLLEFEHIYEEGPTKAIIQPWPVNNLRLACDHKLQQLFSTALEGHRMYLRRSWCSGYKKLDGITRDSIVAEAIEKIKQEHIEL